MQILIVDNSQTTITALRDFLTSNGYDVISAKNGKEGLDLLEQYPTCRMVVSGWEMSEMNGIEFCKAVRSKKNYIYFVFLTAYSGTDVVQGLDVGADDFIAKPYNPTEFLARLRVGSRIIPLMK
jgi:DNA-binding response OmpR family regulator